MILLLVLVVTGVAADSAGHEHHHTGPHGDAYQAVRNAIDKLDNQFLYLLSTITSKILYIIKIYVLTSWG